MGHAYQDGSDVVGFDADTGIYIKTYTIAQLTKDDTDLWIYLQTGKEALELTRRPSFIKASLTHDPILSVESKSGGSLVIRFDRGGNNHYEMSLTIVHRKGQFWVAGFTKAWDTQQGIGSCDINFLTGRGVAARGLAAARPLKGRFAPIKLVDWSPDRQPRACTR